MGEANGVGTADGARRGALKRKLLRLGAPVALLAVAAGATPADAADPHACIGLVAAAEAGAVGAPTPDGCGVEPSAVYDWWKKVET